MQSLAEWIYSILPGGSPAAKRRVLAQLSDRMKAEANFSPYTITPDRMARPDYHAIHDVLLALLEVLRHHGYDDPDHTGQEPRLGGDRAIAFPQAEEASEPTTSPLARNVMQHAIASAQNAIADMMRQRIREQVSDLFAVPEVLEPSPPDWLAGRTLRRFEEEAARPTTTVTAEYRTINMARSEIVESARPQPGLYVDGEYIPGVEYLRIIGSENDLEGEEWVQVIMYATDGGIDQIAPGKSVTWVTDDGTETNYTT